MDGRRAWKTLKDAPVKGDAFPTPCPSTTPPHALERERRQEESRAAAVARHRGDRENHHRVRETAFCALVKRVVLDGLVDTDTEIAALTRRIPACTGSPDVRLKKECGWKPGQVVLRASGCGAVTTAYENSFGES